jgi:subtilase family serine protease
VTPNDGKRDVPDVALIADPDNDGVYLCNSGTSGGTCTVQGGWGGTSEATPMWVAMMAIIEQSKHGKALAEPHKRLYALAKSSQYRTLFHDIVSGNNGVPLGDDPYYPNNSFAGYNAGPGFDLTTGWGSFDGAKLEAAY